MQVVTPHDNSPDHIDLSEVAGGVKWRVARLRLWVDAGVVLDEDFRHRDHVFLCSKVHRTQTVLQQKIPSAR